MTETSPISAYAEGEHQKTSILRILDVFLISPIIINIGIKTENMAPFTRVALVGMGVGTMLYNGANLIGDILHEK